MKPRYVSESVLEMLDLIEEQELQEIVANDDVSEVL